MEAVAKEPAAVAYRLLLQPRSTRRARSSCSADLLVAKGLNRFDAHGMQRCCICEMAIAYIVTARAPLALQ
jgi:hypothetical protein